MECVADATTAGFWSRRLEEGGSPTAEDASLDTTLPGGPLHPKCLRRGPGTGPGPPYSGSYRKFVNHLVRSNFSDNLNDDSSFVGVEADAPRAPALDCILDDVLAEERDVVVRPLRPPRPPPRLGQHRAGRARGSSALWSGWAPSLTSISASAPLCLCLGPEQQTPPTPPPTENRITRGVPAVLTRRTNFAALALPVARSPNYSPRRAVRTPGSPAARRRPAIAPLGRRAAQAAQAG